MDDDVYKQFTTDVLDTLDAGDVCDDDTKLAALDRLVREAASAAQEADLLAAKATAAAAAAFASGGRACPHVHSALQLSDEAAVAAEKVANEARLAALLGEGPIPSYVGALDAAESATTELDAVSRLLSDAEAACDLARTFFPKRTPLAPLPPNGASVKRQHSLPLPTDTTTKRRRVTEPLTPPQLALDLGLGVPKLHPYIERCIRPHANADSYWELLAEIKLGAPHIPNQDGWAAAVVQDLGAANVAMLFAVRGPARKTGLLRQLFEVGYWTQEEVQEMESLPGAVWTGPDKALDPDSGLYALLLLERVDADTPTRQGTVAPAGSWILRASYGGLSLYVNSRLSQHLDVGSGGVMAFHRIMGQVFRPDVTADMSEIHLPTQFLPSQRPDDIMDTDMTGQFEYGDDGTATAEPRGRGERGWKDVDVPDNIKVMTVIVSSLKRQDLSDAITAMSPKWATDKQIALASTGVLRWGENELMTMQGAASTEGWRNFFDALDLDLPRAPLHEVCNQAATIGAPPLKVANTFRDLLKNRQRH